MIVNDEELAALRGLPLGAQVLYLCGLRPVMDYRTGEVGRASAVSWERLASVLETDGKPGIAHCRPSKDQMRRLMGQLVRGGLVFMCSDMVGKQLIVRLLLAHSDKSARKKAATNPPVAALVEAATADDGVDSLSGNGFSNIEPNNPPQTRHFDANPNPPHIRYPVDRDEMIARAGAGECPEGGSPGEVGESDGNASAGVATADFRLLLGQDGAPSSAVQLACVKVTAVQRTRDVSADEMRAAIADARGRGARCVAAYAATVIESGSLVAPTAKVVPFAGRSQASRAGSALDGILAAAGGAMGYD